MKHFFFALSITALVAIASNASAKTDTIYFGGTNGSPAFGYSPSTVTVNVGDTIVWSGPFNGHTLQSGSPKGSIPAAADTFAKKDFTGNSFSYVVTVAGTYNYECTLHFAPPNNMYGSFTAVAAGVAIPPQPTMSMQPVYPNPAQTEAMVDFTLVNPVHVTLRIYNAEGTLVQTPTDENMDAGMHMLMIDTKSFTSGNYEYVLQAGDAVLQRSAIVVK